MSKLRTDFYTIKRPGKLCSCCRKVATHTCCRQTSWFRGEDDDYLLCDDHFTMAKADEWSQLNDAMANEQYRRKNAATKKGDAS